MHLTRRFFLQSTGALAAYCGVTPLSALAAADPLKSARPVTAGKTLVVIFLRGGMDGLNMIVPHADPHYAKLRQSLRIDAPGKPGGCLDLDGRFGLHPRAAALMPLVDAGHFAAIHAVGYDDNTRSHFEEQDTWETGVIGNTLGSDGWLNRHLLTSAGRGPVRAVALSDTLPRILRGDAPAYAVRGISDLAMPGSRVDGAKMTAALEHAYGVNAAADGASVVTEADIPELRALMGDADDLVHQTGAITLEGVKLIQRVARQPYQPAAEYPEGSLGDRLKEAARLIKADIGVEVIEIDYGGWDTHQNQAQGSDALGGTFGNKVERLARATAAFARDLGDRLDDTLVLTLSDFGRTARENGTRGTDHGWANCMLAMGGAVAKAPPDRAPRVDGSSTGRRAVMGDWPGLAEDQLHQKRDLQHTTDFRDVLSEVVRVHLGNPHLETVLPQHTFKPVGLVG